MLDDNPLNAPCRPAASADDPFSGSVQPAADLEYLLTPEPERSIGPVDVIGRTLHLLATRPLALLGLLLASMGVLFTLTLVLNEMSSPLMALMRDMGLGKVATGLQAAIIGVLAWAASTVVQAPIAGAAIEARTGQRNLLTEFFRRGVRHLPAVLGSAAALAAISIVLLITAIGAEMLIMKVASMLPGRYPGPLAFVAGSVVVVWLALRTMLGFSLVVPIVLIEQLGAKAALRRSWMLTAGHRYAIAFGILLPVIGLSIATVLVASAAPTVAVWFNLATNVFIVLYATAMAPASYVAFREFVDATPPEKLL